MKLFTIKNTGLFMTRLLSEKETAFDNFLLNEASVISGISYIIDGRLNKNFYSETDYEQMRSEALEKHQIFSEDFIRFNKVKPFCYNCIKGKNTPLSFKFVFHLPKEEVLKLVENIDCGFSINDINSLNITIKYDGTATTCTTAISLKVFTLDKTLENSWDNYIYGFLTTNGINID